MAVYLDSSALVKLVIEEAESRALRSWLEGHDVRFSSALATVEVPRAVVAEGSVAATRAREILGRIGLLAVDDGILEAARDLDPRVLRSLDAIHLASALEVGEELETVVAYDRRLLDAASALGLPVAAPG